MGEEYGENAPFQFFSDHIDPDIAQATREGRREEFAAFAAFSKEEIPDPQDPATFERSKLTHQADPAVVWLYRELLSLRRDLPAGDADEIAFDEAARWLRVRRGAFELVANFGAEQIVLPCGQASLRLMTSTASQLFDGAPASRAPVRCHRGNHPPGRMREIWPGRPFPMGATWDGSGTNFALFSEHAESVELCLFDEQGSEERIELTQRRALNWHCYLPGVGPGQRYGYRVHGVYAPLEGKRFNPDKLLIDPYAKAIEGVVDWGHDANVLPYVPDGTEDADLEFDDEDDAAAMPKSVVIDT